MMHLPQFNSTGGRAHRLSGYFSVLAILLTLIAPSAVAGVPHVSNPYAGATWYLDSYFAQEVAPAAAVSFRVFAFFAHSRSLTPAAWLP